MGNSKNHCGRESRVDAEILAAVAALTPAQRMEVLHCVKRLAHENARGACGTCLSGALAAPQPPFPDPPAGAM